MTRSNFTMADVTRRAKAVTKAGLSIGRVEFTPEKIVFIVRDQSEASRGRDDEAGEGRNEWDPV
jgi:hypothetical protein